MQGTILIFRPRQAGAEVQRFNHALDLGDLRAAIGGGRLEPVPGFASIEHDGAVHRCHAFCDEEGKLNYRTSPDKTEREPDPPNASATLEWDRALRRAGYPGLIGSESLVTDYLVGQVAVVYGDEEFMGALYESLFD